MTKGYIRQITINDAKLVLDWRNQDFVRNNMYNNNIIDYDTHMDWFHNMLRNDSSKYFIYERESIPMGVIGFYNIDKKNKKASWAFYLGSEKFRGAGVEMEQLALDYAFNKLGLYKLYCEVLSFNFSVVEFHKKFGFKIEGIRKKDYCRDEEYYDIYQLALLKDEYDELIVPVENKLPKTSQIKLANDNLVGIIGSILDSHSNYPGKNYKLLDIKFRYYKNYLTENLMNIKAKLVFQTKDTVNIEYFLLINGHEISISEISFERTK